ncbi:uncharacterized protein BDZ99DRAFT_467600 [Mytilinidion resinicola]|uniref:Uncharacterized protein n=1 Tax=Mytilinidion resinicola TaxID=574789 RepID=A0A6A6Y6T0_9PEZI|nr:uncharacterized protein BDZ99DRAFT_467600 [Mytilinidion resinicola]KAF2804309.1 hypothetical protein BDZ99DRAFT_467600 [Mytilinidion resinicola]
MQHPPRRTVAHSTEHSRRCVASLAIAGSWVSQMAANSARGGKFDMPRRAIGTLWAQAAFIVRECIHTSPGSGARSE